MAFFNNVDPSVAASHLAVAAPHSYATFNSTIVEPCYGHLSDGEGRQAKVPLTYLICANDQGIPESLQRHMIRKTTEHGGANWRVWRCNAGHNPAISQVETVNLTVRKVAREDVVFASDIFEES